MWYFYVMGENQKKFVSFIIIASTALILAIGVWTNYRPVILHSACGDVASNSAKAFSRATLETDGAEINFDSVYNDCLRDAGVK